MKLGVTCEACGASVPDATATLFMNARARGYHVVLRCACGIQVTDRRVVLCALRTTRAMIDAHKAKEVS